MTPAKAGAHVGGLPATDLDGAPMFHLDGTNLTVAELQDALSHSAEEIAEWIKIGAEQKLSVEVAASMIQAFQTDGLVGIHRAQRLHGQGQPGATIPSLDASATFRTAGPSVNHRGDQLPVQTIQRLPNQEAGPPPINWRQVQRSPSILIHHGNNLFRTLKRFARRSIDACWALI